jgi:hypothetical protein
MSLLGMVTHPPSPAASTSANGFPPDEFPEPDDDPPLEPPELEPVGPASSS